MKNEYLQKMKTTGIRISDKENRVVSVELPDILCEIKDGNSFFWSIMFLDIVGNLGDETDIIEFTDNISKAERGLFIDWKELNFLAKKIYQTIDITILGCKDKSLLQRYETDQKQYETCDIVIEMIDSSFWLVFSKDGQLIQRLASKFNDIEFVNSDHWSDLE